MLRTLAAASLLTVACAMPLQQAAAQDPVAGGIFGGAAGAIIGGALGGRGGAVAGAIIGGTTGAAIAAQGQRRANGYYWYNNGCYIQRPDGAWIGVAPQYCGGPAYGPPPAAYGPPPAYGPGPAGRRRGRRCRHDGAGAAAPGERGRGRGLRTQIPLVRSAQRHVPVARRHAQTLPVTPGRLLLPAILVVRAVGGAVGA